ncbi:MAG: phospho-N-acetylmuramoyl-pentapeptide-transferase [Thermoleophilia bacterium]
MNTINIMPRILIAAIGAMTLLLFLGPRFIQWLRDNEVGQFVRPQGLIPEGHAEKQGTPTMGGLLILFATAVPFLVLSAKSTAAMLVLFTTLACGLIGFLDDFTKIVRKRSLGLSGRLRILGLLVVSAVLVYVATQVVGVETSLAIQPLHVDLELGYVGYSLLVALVVVGSANAVNLTDGLDGLAAGTTAIAMLAYTGMAFVSNRMDLAMFGATTAAACVGFVWFNSHPATVFMGDTGSYALGGAIAGMAVMTKTEVLLGIIGAVFVAEALSVMLQVVVFKRFRRRVFLMAPLHHHFEMAGWSETKIIVRLWLIALIGAAVGFTLYFRAILQK